MKTIRSEKGFTLVEVMIALAVLAVGILTLYTMQTRAILGTATASTFTEMTSESADRVEQLYALAYLDASLTAGNHIDGDTSWTVVDDNPINGCKLITVTTNQISGGRAKTMTIRFIKSIIQQ